MVCSMYKDVVRHVSTVVGKHGDTNLTLHLFVTTTFVTVRTTAGKTVADFYLYNPWTRHFGSTSSNIDQKPQTMC